MEKMAQSKENVNRAFSYGVREGPSPGGGIQTKQWEQELGRLWGRVLYTEVTARAGAGYVSGMKK